MPELFSNGGVLTTLNGGINNSVTSITTHAAPPSELQAQGQFRIAIGGTVTPIVVGGVTVGNLIQGGEILLVSGAPSGTSWTVARGQEGTAAASHSDGDSVIHIVTAASAQAVATNPIGDTTLRQNGVLLGAFFDTNNGGSLQLMASQDGYQFAPLSEYPVMSPPGSGDPAGVHDPSILIIDPNRTYSPQPTHPYWIAYDAAVQPSRTLTIMYSDDMRTWTQATTINADTSGAGTGHAWAPEWFVDRARDFRAGNPHRVGRG